ncbi:hypothetical protein [Streptomyces griseoluteus]|uniref:hypothetical protein n=1 Tax=Streptomyces griseoluteus TaxID=29306 RepID=UPI003678C67E
MAHTAGHLLVARHDYSDTTLDALAAPRPAIRGKDLMQHARPNPGPYLGVGVGRVAGAGTDPVDVHWTPPSRHQREQRFLRQNRGGPTDDDTLGFEEFDTLMAPDPQELNRRIEQVLDEQQRRSTDYPAPRLQRPATHDHAQQESAAHQQHFQGPGRM